MGENKVKIILDVDDQGTVKIQKFASTTHGTLKDLETRSGSLTRAFTAVSGAIAAAFAVERVVAFGRECLGAYASAQKAETMLAEAMRQRGVYTDAALAQNLALAKSMQAQSVYDDEAIADIERMLIYYGAEGKELERLTRATLDLASAKGLDLSTAAEKVGKAVAGSAKGLKAYGIEVKGAAFSADRMHEITTKLITLFGGAAAAETRTLSGQTKQLHNSWDDTKEVMGEVLAPMQGSLIKALKDASEQTGEYVKQNEDMIALGIEGTVKGIAVAFDAVTVALGAVGKAYETAQPALDWIGTRDKATPLITQGRGAQANWDARQKAAVEHGQSVYGNSDIVQGAIVRPAATPPTKNAPPSASGGKQKKDGKEYTPSWEYGFDTGPGWLSDNSAPSWLEQRRSQIDQAAREHRAGMEDLARLRQESAMAEAEFSGADEFSLARERENMDYSRRVEDLKQIYGERQDLQEAFQSTSQTQAAEHAARLKAIDQDEADTTKALRLDKWRVSLEYGQADSEMIQALAQDEQDTILELSGSYAAAAKAKREFLVDANLDIAASNDDFWAGVKAARDQDLKNLYTWGQAGIDLYHEFAASSRDALSDVLFDGIKGEMKSFEDYWRAFSSSLLRAFTDAVSQMIVQWMMAKTMMAGASLLSGLFGGASSSAASTNTAGGLSNTTSGLSLGNYSLHAGGGTLREPVIGIGKSGHVYIMREAGEDEHIVPESKALDFAVSRMRSVEPMRTALAAPTSGAATPAASATLINQGGNTINVPMIVHGATKRQASELRAEIESTCERVIRRWS